MSFKALMVIKAVVCLLFGIAFIFFPGFLLSIFGVKLGAGGLFTAREYGATLWGNLMLTWFARNAGVSATRSAIILALFVYDLIGFVVSLVSVLTGVLNPVGWLPVIVYLFFTIGFGAFLIKKPGAAEAPATS
jgi:hypothetical protein